MNAASTQAPAISVVIPARNEAHIIDQALQSVIEQEAFGAHVEIVVVDDSSTDGTAQVAEQFPQTVVVPNTGTGLTDALNSGLAAARGPIIARLDADDRYLDGALERLTRPLLDRPDIDLVAAGALEIGSDGRYLGQVRPPVDERHAAFAHAAGCMFTHSAVAYRRSVVLEAGGYHQRAAAEDFDLWVRLVRRGCRMVGDSTNVAVRTIHRQSVSNENIKHQRASGDQLRQEARDDILEPFDSVAISLLRELKRMPHKGSERGDLQVRSIRIARALWRSGSRTEATRLAWVATAHTPVGLARAFVHARRRRRRLRTARGFQTSAGERTRARSQRVGVRARRLGAWVKQPRAVLARTRRSPYQDNAAHDISPPVEPQLTLILATMPRTGSNLLANALETSRAAGVPREYFNASWLSHAARERGLPVMTSRARRRQWTRRVRLRKHWEAATDYDLHTIREYTDDLMRRRTTPNGVFAVKLHAEHLEWIVNRFGSVDDLFRTPVRWVYLTRADRLARAVSLVRARQTGAWSSQWNSTHVPEAARYEPNAIENALKTGDAGDQQWARFFEDSKLAPIQVTYEELAAHPATVTTRVLDELGLEHDPAALTENPVGLKRQTDSLNDDWAERFRRDRPNLGL